MAGEPASTRKQILLLAIVLLPSLAVLICGLDMPHLGFLRDDGIYLASAESLAKGEGYRIASRPGTPWNVKYPPLYSALLSPVFLIGAPPAAGLALASVLNWLALLIFAALCLVFFRRHLFPAPLLLTLFCLSFTGTVNCAHSLLSDLWMACAVLAALLVRERSAAGAALLTAAAVLIRTASLALLAALIADSVRQRRFRQAALAGVVAGLPALLWMAWSSAHRGPIADINDYYMSTYFDYLSHEIPPGRLLQHAAGLLIHGVTQTGRIFLPDILWPEAPKWALGPLGIAVLGCLRFLPRAHQWFVGLSILQMLVWPYEPVLRFYVPLVPFLAAAAASGAARLGRRLRMSAPAGLLAVPVALLFWGEEFQQAYLMHHYRARNAQMAPVVEWIRTRTPADATFATYRDARLYFDTGRRAEAVESSFWQEREQPGSSLRRVFGVATWARARGHRYILLAPDDYLLPDWQWQQLKEELGRQSVIAFEAGGAFVFDLTRAPAGR